MRGDFHLPEESDEPPVSVEEALSRILSRVRPLGPQTVRLEEAAGRYLASDIRADRNVPGFANSAMDGYAVRAAELAHAHPANPASLPLAGDVTAGSRVLSLEPGQALRIMTGAPIPRGADAVVPVEWTDRGDRVVTITRAPRRGANIRAEDDDITEGQLVLRQGAPLDAASVGVLASLGRTNAEVGARPRVSIISTGDELVEPGTAAGPGQIVNTNRLTLTRLGVEAGAGVVSPSLVRDDPDAGRGALAAALDESDVVITTGAASVGTRDWMREVLRDLGVERLFWRIAMKPGKPVIAGVRGSRLVFGLPGNPVSCVVAFHLFVRPTLLRLQGAREIHHPVVYCRAAAPMRSSGDRTTYLRVRVSAVDGELVALPMSSQGSGVLSSLAGANGLAIVRAGSTEVAEGRTIETVLIGPVGASRGDR